MRKGWRRAPPPAAKGGASSLRPLIESAWQKLPLGVANSLGGRLRRYITL